MHPGAARPCDNHAPMSLSDLGSLGEFVSGLEVGLRDLMALSPEDRRRFNAYNSARFRHYDNLDYPYRAGTLEENPW